MSNLSAIEEKYKILADAFPGQGTFYMEDVQHLFPDLKKSTVYWYVSKMIEEGYIRRIRNGVYSLTEKRQDAGVILSDTGERVIHIMEETGFDFFLSGLDVLQRFMQHIPDSFPSMLFIRKETKDEVFALLREKGMVPVFSSEAGKMLEYLSGIRNDSPSVIVYFTGHFIDCDGELATREKAFVDLYYAVTRNDYPLPLQELTRIYENLVRQGMIDKKKMVSIASRRSLQHDIRYIAESEYITDDARRFVEMLDGEK